MTVTQAAVTFPGFPVSVRDARRWVTSHGDGLTEDVLYSLGLMVSELITNSLRYSRSAGKDAGVVVTVEADEHAVTVKVIDGGHAMNVPRLVDPNYGAAETGRGLCIVDELADAWGVDDLPDGRRAVWCQVKL